MHSQIRISLLFSLLMLLFNNVTLQAQTRPEALPPLDSLSLGEMQSLYGSLFATTILLDSMIQMDASTADSLRMMAQDNYNLAKKDSTVVRSSVDSLGKEAKMAKERFSQLNNQQKKAAKLHKWMESVPVSDSLALKKNLAKAWKQTRQLYDERYPPAPEPIAQPAESAADTSVQVSSAVTPEVQKVADKQAQPMVKQTLKYNPANDVMLHPPVPPCLVASTVRDEFSGEITRDMVRSEWFRYTNPALKNYLQGKTHVICDAALSSKGADYFLQLTFTIQDPNARKAFGRLDQNSIAMLKFLDGTSFTLQNAVPDDGVYNPETEIMTYRATYPLNAEVMKKIRRTETDRIRIAWSKGYDDYEIQQVDLLQRQAACLSGK
ncbi:MAG: hypothetical protein IT261_11430 [Saprospiraceae bacterium]|nr:hypothetical protein [Saprospiraceae bacterium]